MRANVGSIFSLISHLSTHLQPNNKLLYNSRVQFSLAVFRKIRPLCLSLPSATTQSALHPPTFSSPVSVMALSGSHDTSYWDLLASLPSPSPCDPGELSIMAEVSPSLTCYSTYSGLGQSHYSITLSRNDWLGEGGHMTQIEPIRNFHEIYKRALGEESSLSWEDLRWGLSMAILLTS